MLKSAPFPYFLVGILFFYYLLAYFFFQRLQESSDVPVLRQRLGTVLWHLSDSNHQNYPLHLYCYYPSGRVSFPGKSGEYLIKKVESLDQCQGWYGMAEASEPDQVSEREKIWWPQALTYLLL